MPKVPEKRRILCPLCDAPLEIGRRTMSTICTKCQQPIRTEDVAIDGYWAGTEFYTAGTVHVQKRGVLIGKIRADNLIVEGEAKGPIRSRDRIEVGKKGRIYGDVTARVLKVEDGAAFVGRVSINPANHPPPPKDP